MNWHTKTYKELTKDELYSLLRLRAEVFVVEQDCSYQDVDNKDQKAFHLLAIDKGEVVAYLRIFKPGDYFQEFSIGRVVVKLTYRGQGLAHKAMQQAVTFIDKKYPKEHVRISAQTYLKDFYQVYGFKRVGEDYLEDGLPHIAMLRD